MKYQNFISIFFLIFLSDVTYSKDEIQTSFSRTNNRIVGGTPPGRDDFLYKCAIYLYKETDSSVNFCSGSIISEKFVLTAAHCFTNVNSGTIYAGVHNLQNEDPAYEWDFDTRHIIKHENYVEEHFLNDIALIDASSNPFVFSTKIKRIRIAPAMSNVTDFVGKTVRVAGWGLTSDSNQEMSDTLLFFNPLVLDTDVCRQIYGSTKVTSNSICLDSSDGRSTCSGDSGSGSEIMSVQENLLIGVVSFGLEAGCEKRSPTVSTFIPPYYNWITSKINGKLN